MIRVLNQLPTYENMSAAFEYLIDMVISQENQTKHPHIKIDNEGIGSHPIEIMEKMLQHRKERMFFMIVNLLRMRPQIFMEQISAFKARCDLRHSAVRGLLVFSPEDVDQAMDML